MAKKKQTKKHKFKYAGPTEPGVVAAGVGAVSGASNGGGASTVAQAGTQARVGVVAGARDFSYVGRDLRRVVVFAVSLVALEIVLWYLFGHTGIGNAVYTFVKV